jgi:hypothetical protein
MKINDETNEVKYVESLFGEMTEDEQKRFTYKFNPKEKTSIQKALSYDHFSGFPADWGGIEDFMKWTRTADKDPGQDFPDFWCLVTPLQGPDVANLTFWDIGTQPSKFPIILDVLELLKTISEQSETNRVLHMDTHDENMACLKINGQWKGILHDPGKVQFVNDHALFMEELVKLYSGTRAVNKTIKRIFKEQEKKKADEPDCSVGDPERNENNGGVDDLGEKMVAWMKKSDGNYTRFTKAFDIIHVFIVLEDILYVYCKREAEDFAPRKNVADFNRIVSESLHNLCKNVMNEKLGNIDKPISEYINNTKRGWEILEALPASKNAAATFKEMVEKEKAEEDARIAERNKKFNNYSRKLKAERLERLARENGANKGGRRKYRRKTRKFRR